MERLDWIVPTGGAEKGRTAILSILVASGLAVLKSITFLLTGSVGVLASAADSVMDVSASAVNLLAIRVADSPDSRTHRYGRGKAEGMAGLFQGLVIGASAVYLIVESIDRLLHREPIEQPLVGVMVMVFSMAATILLVRRMKRVAKEADSLALEADSVHYLSDVLANGAVLLGLLAFHWFRLWWLDPVISLAISLVILHSVWRVFRDSFDNLMDRQLPLEERQRIEGILEQKVPGVLGFHDLRTRRSGARRFVDIHVEIDRNLTFTEAHRIAEEATREIEEGLANCRVLVHADPWPPDPDAYREPAVDNESRRLETI